MASQYRVGIEELRNKLECLFDYYGCVHEVVNAIVDVLIDAELSGTKTHGVRLLPIYLTRMKKGSINVKPKITFAHKYPAIGNLDGDNGPGAYAGVMACKYVQDMAETYGIGAVTVHNSGHFGPAGYYCRLGAEKGLISIVSTNGSSVTAPTGSIQPFFSATPLAIGTPSRDGSAIILDMALTMSARARIRSFARQGLKIPDDWALDANGKPTDDPNAALEGSLLPIGGYKGYGLLFMMEILTAVLGGASIGPDVKDLYADAESPQGLGHCFIGIKIDSCIETANYFRSLTDLIHRVKRCEPIDEATSILIPGEKENNLREEQLFHGIVLTDEAATELNVELRKAGLPCLM